MTEFVNVPFFYEISVSKDGCVRDNITGSILPTFSYKGQKRVKAIKSGAVFLLEVGRLVILTFRTPKMPIKLYRNFQIEYIDGDSHNATLDNLRLIGPKSLIPYLPKEGFFYIPEFTRYVISKEGVVFDTLKNEEVGHTYPQYVTVTLVKDGETISKSRSLHRLLMLTFRPIKFNGEKMLVNHIDGNKLNFELDNLEWCDYRWNNTHAILSGLRTDNHPVIVRDILTDSEETFISIGNCANHFGVRPNVIWTKVTSKTNKLFKGHLLIKLASDDSPWPEITKEQCFIPLQGQPNAVLVKDVNTGEITEYDSITSASNNIGVHRAVIEQYLRRRTPRAKNGFLFKLKTDKRPWVKNTLKEGEVFRVPGRDYSRKVNFKITNTLTGEINIVKGTESFKSVIGIDPRTVHWHIRKSNDGKTCKHFTIEKLRKK